MTTKQRMKTHFINETTYTWLTKVRLKLLQIKSYSQASTSNSIKGITMCLGIQNKMPPNNSHEQTQITCMICTG
jgi:hypothetical protein